MLLRLAYLPMGCCVASCAVITTRSEVVLSYRGSMDTRVAMHGYAAKPFFFLRTVMFIKVRQARPLGGTLWP
jgi:hypothetical protein